MSSDYLYEQDRESDWIKTFRDLIGNETNYRRSLCDNDADVLWRDRAPEQRNMRSQVIALRSAYGTVGRQSAQDDATHGQRA